MNDGCSTHTWEKAFRLPPLFDTRDTANWSSCCVLVLALQRTARLLLLHCEGAKRMLRAVWCDCTPCMACMLPAAASGVGGECNSRSKISAAAGPMAHHDNLKIKATVEYASGLVKISLLSFFCCSVLDR